MVQVIRHSVTGNNYDVITEVEESDFIQHHGILGMKWGVRRYQNEDGSLTDAGRNRYGVENVKDRINNTEGIRNKQKVAKTEIAKSVAKTVAGTSTALGAAHLANYAMKHAWQIRFLKDVVAAGGSGRIMGRTLTAREAEFVLKHDWGAIATTILPVLDRPLGQLALGAATIGGTGLAAYNIYKGIKVAQVNKELKSEVENIIKEYEKEETKK